MRSIIIFLTLMSTFGSAGDSTLARVNSSQKTREGDEVRRETRKTFDEIFAGLKKLRAKYPQLAEIERAFITESQLSYEYGRVECRSKAKPCSFSENACRVTINIEHIARREDADLHAAASLLFELGDGTFLDVFYGVLAEPTAARVGWLNRRTNMMLLTIFGVSTGVLLYRVRILRRACETSVAALASAPIVLMYPLFLVIFNPLCLSNFLFGFLQMLLISTSEIFVKRSN